jgi:hypothetical protein
VPELAVSRSADLTLRPFEQPRAEEYVDPKIENATEFPNGQITFAALELRFRVPEL